MKIVVPSDECKQEFAGRVYELIDLQLAIEGGRLKTIDDVLKWSKETASSMNKMMELKEWVMNGCFVDIRASIQRGKEDDH